MGIYIEFVSGVGCGVRSSDDINPSGAESNSHAQYNGFHLLPRITIQDTIDRGPSPQLFVSFMVMRVDPLASHAQLNHSTCPSLVPK